jgi:hypothetical protein
MKNSMDNTASGARGRSETHPLSGLSRASRKTHQNSRPSSGRQLQNFYEFNLPGF